MVLLFGLKLLEYEDMYYLINEEVKKYLNVK